jgi:ketosteroid isomerase-like protein
MSQENVEIVRRCYELWDSRQWSAIPELFDPDVEIDLSRNVFNPDVYHGHAEVERYVSAVEEVWDEFHVVPSEFFDGGDNVVTAVTLHGRGKGSGVNVKTELFDSGGYQPPWPNGSRLRASAGRNTQKRVVPRPAPRVRSLYLALTHFP